MSEPYWPEKNSDEDKLEIAEEILLRENRTDEEVTSILDEIYG